jgi:uncharacterized membrane protein (DUF4010 family)
VDVEQVVIKLVVALGLGLLVGLQRERVHARLAGIRTVALVTVGGAVFALLGSVYGGWVVAAGAVGVAALLVVGNLPPAAPPEDEPGLTTEVAVLLMYGVGALAVVGPTEAAVAVGGCTAMLLHFKGPLHRFVARIDEAELKGVMQFVLVAVVVWPVLPNRTLDARGVINPTEVWFAVVVLVGLNLCGFAASRAASGRKGALVGGLLGGLVSSTATTVSYARLAGRNPNGVRVARTVILVASAVSVVRILAEVAVAAPTAFPVMALRPALMLAGVAALSAGVFLLGGRTPAEPIAQDNPAQLKTAVLFGLLYVGVKWGVAVAGEHFGAAGLFGIAALAGLHDVDAVTLSTSALVEQGRLDPHRGTRLILTAAAANLGWKAVLAGLFGGRRVLLACGWALGAAAAFGVVLILVP